MSYPLVYVVLANWNRTADTLECLESLTQQSYPNLRLLVVDNASTDGAPKLIEERFPQVEQVLNPKNLGFTGGYNAGMRASLQGGADFIFVLNNDTLLAPDTIQLLVDASTPEDVGMVSPMIFFAVEPDKIWSAGGTVSRLTLEITDNHGREKKFSEITERDFLSGCAMLIKRPVLEKVGMFDDNFFWYYEDSDLSLRVRQAGYRLLLVPQAQIWHKVSMSSGGSDSPVERYFMGRNSTLFFRKHIHGWRRLVIIIWRALSTVKIILRLLINKRPKSARAYLRGMWDGFRMRYGSPTNPVA